jgi:hypothetical protein
MWFSITQGDKLGNSAPFATVAIAGHVYGGYAFCECGTSGCICDPGEQPQSYSVKAGNSQQGQSTAVDFGATADNAFGLGFIAMTMLLLWLKLRA